MTTLFHIMIGVVLAGLPLSWALVHERSRRARLRRDEAAQFETGDVVTFGDGSRIVVASLPELRKGRR